MILRKTSREYQGDWLMNKKRMRMTAIILCFVFVTSVLSGCGEQDKVERLISDFETACQTANVEKIFDCCDPEVIEPVESVMGLFGLDANTLSGVVYAIIGTGMLISADSGDTDEMEALLESLASIELEPTDYEFNESKDVCNVTVTYSTSMYGEPYSEEGVIVCVLRDDEWYLALY